MEISPRGVHFLRGDWHVEAKGRSDANLRSVTSASNFGLANATFT
jgi:hypothetical protein